MISLCYQKEKLILQIWLSICLGASWTNCLLVIQVMIIFTFFIPFMQNELPEYIELELDDIAPGERYIAEDAEVSTNGSFCRY
jgi:hypothetical protein